MGWNNSKAISYNTARSARTIGAHANFYLPKKTSDMPRAFHRGVSFFPLK